MERSLAIRLQEKGVRYTTQVELPVSTADFYFNTYPRPLVVYVDGPPHLKMKRAIKDELIRRTLRAVGYRVLELPYTRPNETQTDMLLKQILEAINYEPPSDMPNRTASSKIDSQVSPV